MANKTIILLTAVGKDFLKGLAPLGRFFRCGSEQNKHISSLCFSPLCIWPTRCFLYTANYPVIYSAWI